MFLAKTFTNRNRAMLSNVFVSAPCCSSLTRCFLNSSAAFPLNARKIPRFTPATASTLMAAAAAAAVLPAVAVAVAPIVVAAVAVAGAVTVAAVAAVARLRTPSPLLDRVAVLLAIPPEKAASLLFKTRTRPAAEFPPLPRAKAAGLVEAVAATASRTRPGSLRRREVRKMLHRKRRRRQRQRPL